MKLFLYISFYIISIFIINLIFIIFIIILKMTNFVDSWIIVLQFFLFQVWICVSKLLNSLHSSRPEIFTPSNFQFTHLCVAARCKALTNSFLYLDYWGSSKKTTGRVRPQAVKGDRKRRRKRSGAENLRTFLEAFCRVLLRVYSRYKS